MLALQSKTAPKGGASRDLDKGKRQAQIEEDNQVVE